MILDDVRPAKAVRKQNRRKEKVYGYLTNVLQEVFSAEVKVIITGN